MRIAYIDFETYYSSKDGYTLSRMGIEEYVRNPRLDVHLLGAAVNDGEVQVYRREEVSEAVRLLNLTDKNTLTVIQNAKFDGFILAHVYGIVPANPVCTRAMFRWVGGSRMSRESLAAQCEFLGTGEKGGFITSMDGRAYNSLSSQELLEYMRYNALDVEDLRANFKAMLPRMSVDAMRFIIMSELMYIDPVFQLDTDKLLAYKQTILEARAKAREKLNSLFPFASDEDFIKALRSKAQFCKMLEKLGAAIPYKLSEKKTETRRKQYEKEGIKADPTVYEPALAKTDIEFQELCQSEDDNVALLCQTRAENNSSIELSRCETLIAMSRRGSLPVSLEPYLAWSGRYTASNSADTGLRGDRNNLQNLSKRGRDTTLRQCINPPKGYVIVAADSSQIEARVLAWAAGQQDLLEDFRQGRDPYCSMAEAIYGEPYETVHYYTKGEGKKSDDKDSVKRYKHQRDVAKAAVLQLGYAAGARNFANYLWRNKIHLSSDKQEHDGEAQRIVDVYRTKNAAIKEFWTQCRQALAVMVDKRDGSFGGGVFNFYSGGKAPTIYLPDGFPLIYPELRLGEDKFGGVGYLYTQMDHGKKIDKHIHAGLLCNNIIQGTAFALMRWQALLINERYSVRCNIHDSWACVVPESEGEMCLAYMLQCMKTLPSWANGLPVDAEGSIGKDFTVV